MKQALYRAVVLTLPLLGLGLIWAQTHVMAKQGTEWEVPVQGYDPRDLLRGHYITYRYDWPRLSQGREGNRVNSTVWADRLCISGTAPKIEQTWLPQPNEECDNLLVARENAEEGIYWLDRGMLYIPQAEAKAMQDKLMDSKLQGVVRIRVRKDGLITPIDITFHPRPVEAGQQP